MTTSAITPAEFEKFLRLACVQCAARAALHPTINPFTHGDEFAVRYGPFLVDVAKLAGISIPQARRRMKALQDDGRVLRDDVAGGRTRWWLAGLSAELRPTPLPVAAPVVHATPSPATARQGVTPAPVPVRQHWSDVLGVPRDCSTTDVREAFVDRLASVDPLDLDAEQQRQRIRDAYNARLTEDGISEYE